jgi:hypothetical protein
MAQTHGGKIFQFLELCIFISGGNTDSSTACGCDEAIGFDVARGWCGHGYELLEREREERE